MAVAVQAIVPDDWPPPEPTAAAEAKALADELAALRLRRASRTQPVWGTGDLEQARDTLSQLREHLDRFTAVARAQEERHAAELAAARAERAAATREAQARAGEALELRDRLDTLAYDAAADRDEHAAALAEAEATGEAARRRIAALQRELSDAREQTAAIGDAAEAEAARHAAELERAGEAAAVRILALETELGGARTELAEAVAVTEEALRERDSAQGEARAQAGKVVELRDRLAYAGEAARAHEAHHGKELGRAQQLVETQAGDLAAAIWRLGEMGAEIADLRAQAAQLVDVRAEFARFRERVELRELAGRAQAEADAAAAEPQVRRGRIRRHGWMLGMTAGVLLAGDGVATIVWQEPLTALYNQHEQQRLGGQLPTLIRQFAARGSKAAPSLAEEARYLARTTGPGHALGRVEIPSIGARFVMVQGTATGTLKLGPGHYTGTRLPGQPGTMAVAGHRTTYGAPFRNLGRLRTGARIVLRMPYGRFVYRVSGSRAVRPAQTGILRSAGSAQRLVLTTCDPMFSDARRLAVFARLIKR